MKPVIRIFVDAVTLGDIAEETGLKLTTREAEFNNFRDHLELELLIPPRTRLLLWSSIPKRSPEPPPVVLPGFCGLYKLGET